MKIDELLLKLGITQDLKGYHYIKDCYKFANKQKPYIKIGEIYSNICKNNNNSFTELSVERNIRYAISIIYENNSAFREIYKTKPSNKKFICDLVFNKNKIINCIKEK